MQQQTNRFTTYDLTKEEEATGTTFTPLQLAHLQNLLAGAYKDKLNLVVDSNKVTTFIQTEAELQGRIRTLEFLIEQSNIT